MLNPATNRQNNFSAPPAEPEARSANPGRITQQVLKKSSKITGHVPKRYPLPKEEGRKVTQALRQSIEHMRAARFDNPKGVECETNRRYELSLGCLKELGELNMADHGIRGTLR